VSEGDDTACLDPAREVGSTPIRMRMRAAQHSRWTTHTLPNAERFRLWGLQPPLPASACVHDDAEPSVHLRSPTDAFSSSLSMFKLGSFAARLSLNSLNSL
jgi:hypothetical protein